ncbi:MAG TPA: carbohydrate-binding family 9-like protein, partial [Puia sp.]
AQRHYVCYYTPDKLKIDGQAKEAVWQKAPWTEDFVDIEGDIRPRPLQRTRTRLLWDKENLYIYAELQETDLWGELRQHDTIIFRDNDFEVFIDPDNDTHNYFELEINALGTVMDLFLAKPYKTGGRAVMGWDTHGLQSAVHHSGTMNKPGDTDGGWSVEMAIPLASIRFFGENKFPDDSTLWRINFSRVEWDKDVVGGRYVHRVDSATGRRLPEHNWVWSPQGLVDMHMPEKWGYLSFSTKAAGEGTADFVLPESEIARRYLWEVYYRQRKYRMEHGVYALDLAGLGMSSKAGAAYKLEMEATTRQYTATIKGGGLPAMLMIDNDGKVGEVR